MFSCILNCGQKDKDLENNTPFKPGVVLKRTQVFGQRQGQQRTLDPEKPLEETVAHFEREFFGSAPDLTDAVSVSFEANEEITIKVAEWSVKSSIERAQANPVTGKKGLWVNVGEKDCGAIREDVLKQLGYDFVWLPVYMGKGEDSMDSRSFNAQEHFPSADSTCGAIALNAAIMKCVVSAIQGKEQYSSIFAYGCSRYGKLAVWLAAKAPEITGLFLQSAGPGGVATFTLNNAGGEFLHALVSPTARIKGGWGSWFRPGLQEDIQRIFDKEKVADFDELLLALAKQRDMPIWITSYWSDKWNNPLGHRATYESVRRYSNNVGIEQYSPQHWLWDAIGVPPHCRDFPRFTSKQRRASFKRYIDFLLDPVAKSDPFASEFTAVSRLLVSDWMSGTALDSKTCVLHVDQYTDQPKAVSLGSTTSEV